MKSRGSAKDKNFIDIVFGVMIIFFGFLFTYINLWQYKSGLNADIASEGLLAREIWESKEWIPKDWYVSSETRVISTVNLAALFYGLTHSVSLSMGLSCSVTMIAFFLGICILCKEMEFENTQKYWMLLLMILLPNNKIQLEILYLYAGYYVFHMVLYLATLTFYCRLLKKKKIKWYWLFALMGFHFAMGAQGARSTLMITGPLMAIELVRRAYLLYLNKSWENKENITTGYVVGVNMMAFVGSRLPFSVGYPLSRNIRNAPKKFYEVVMPDFFASMDWTKLSLVEKGIFLGCLLVVVYFMVFTLFKGYKKQIVKEDEWIYLNFVASVFLTIVALTFTTVGSSSRYFTVIFFAIAMGISKLWKDSGQTVRIVLVAGLLIIMVCNSKRVYYPLATDKGYANSDYVRISNYLVEEGFESAYTTFDHANTMTVMGDGQVQISAVSSLSTMEANKWLSSKKWYVPNVPKESKTAYIVSDAREEEFDVFFQEHQDEIEFKTKIGGFNIYGSDINFSNLID